MSAGSGAQRAEGQGDPCLGKPTCLPLTDFIYLFMFEKQRMKERDLSSTGSLPRCPQQQGCCEPRPGSQDSVHGGRDLSARTFVCCPRSQSTREQKADIGNGTGTKPGKSTMGAVPSLACFADLASQSQPSVPCYVTGVFCEWVFASVP